MAPTSHLSRASRALETYGLLLHTDRKLPNLCALVAGRPITGSWWGHPLGHAIFATAGQLADLPDVAIAKLVSSKVTYVHRRLWDPLAAAGSAGESWQIDGLSSTSRKLLELVSKRGALRTDRLESEFVRGAAGSAARELEVRLLVYSEQVHTESGAHAKQLSTWKHWSTRAGFAPTRMPPEQARKKLEETVAELNAAFGGNGQLPWVGKAKALRHRNPVSRQG